VLQSVSCDWLLFLRISRAVEILTKDYSLSSHLRIPATTLTNKKHNVQVREYATIEAAFDASMLPIYWLVPGGMDMAGWYLGNRYDWLLVSQLKSWLIINLLQSWSAGARIFPDIISLIFELSPFFT